MAEVARHYEDRTEALRVQMEAMVAQQGLFQHQVPREGRTEALAAEMEVAVAEQGSLEGLSEGLFTLEQAIKSARDSGNVEGVLQG